MPTGPVEYIIVGFPGNKFTGEIAPELIALVDSGTVRILDLIFIGKDADGSVVSFEIDELDSVAGFEGLDADVGGLISPAGRRVCGGGPRAELVGGAVDLGGCVGSSLRRGRSSVRRGRCSRAHAYLTN